MKRPIVYPASLAQDTDLLSTNQNAMVALAMLSQAVLGTTTLADGLACTPTTPASLNVLVGPGSIYSLANLEATAYGSLAADTANQVVKQGIKLGDTSLAIAPPATSGQSVVYLVQSQFQEADGTPVVLPYYNADNPDVPYSGPANSGVAQNTVRDGRCVISLKVGVAATTGSQTTPSPDAGYVGLWAVTVANGAAAITSGNIAQVPGAPFIGRKLTEKVATVKRQVFTNSGIYIPSPGLLYAHIEVQAGGGGGGGAPGGTGSQAAAATGGAEGGYCSKWLTAAQITAGGPTVAITVGAAGANGAAGNTNGGGGGISSFGPLLTANGGSPGGGQATQSALSLSNAPGVGGTAAGGDLNVQGGPGGYGVAYGGSSIGIGGKGADSRYGRGGNGGASGSGGNATGYGAGGGGAGATTNDEPGGSGAPGIVIVTEYCSQ